MRARLPITAILALAIVCLALVLPVGWMFVRSLQVDEVVTTGGRTYRVAGNVRRTDDAVSFDLQTPDGSEKVPVRLPWSQVVEVRRSFSLTHYESVLSDQRTLALVENSVVAALWGALAAFLLGLPVAWILARVALPGWRVLAALCLAPAVLPPFFIALGGARDVQAVLIDVFALSGPALQLANTTAVFGSVLFPFVVVLVAPAISSVPAGPVESARLLGGSGAALRHVILPAVLPSAVGAFILCFVFAVTDFAVPDLLGFMLPAGEPPTHVFSTEIRLQWEIEGNTGRAVATGAPFVLITMGLVGLAVFLLRRSPLFTAADAGRRRPRKICRPVGLATAYIVLFLVLALSLGLPLLGIASWTSAGETSASGTNTDAAVIEDSGRLFDFERALDATAGIREQRTRWFEIAIATSILSVLVSVPLVHAALRRGGAWRVLALVLGSLPLAVPGIVLAVGTLLLWVPLDVGWVDQGVLRPVLVLLARFLPVSLLATWLAMRGVRRGHDEVAATLGAGRAVRLVRVWAPQVLGGIGIAGLLVLILALREFEAVMLIEDRIYLARLYEKIHFSRLADEANLLFLYLLYVFVPVAAIAVLATIRRRPQDRP